MARRALLVGINDYRGIGDLKGCHNDISNMRDILKTCLGFTNNDIRVVADARATKQAILYRLEYMVNIARPGDFMVFHFSGHGSQIRDRNGDELEDYMDELICPWDMNWDNGFILDDDLDAIFKRIPEGALLEVFLDACHSGTGTRSANLGRPAEASPDHPTVSRYLPPPIDISFRHEDDEDALKKVRGFRSVNRAGSRSTENHILWSGCRSDQTSADAYINGAYNGAFTYYFCKHMRETGGSISRANLLERIRKSLRYNGFSQVPQLACSGGDACNNNPLQFPAPDETRRLLYLTTPYLRGDDVRQLQRALANAGYKISADGVFGPHTREIVRQFQRDNDLVVDGIAGAGVYGALFG
ncbi:hypothetical protein DENIS_0928 [Desulfonema ishimotonii]|uniref:Uncharacterized protein n=1 Tax=Desulfonema ishimotonii TaxID=45657 RepID=A0A401FSQ4_9BACT|nr:caspase family protein [Desulfonema ishimotonii]GBC59986.1 hypothetical protein DENIS_0928 [Desulfonema ishimotonii]